MNLNQNKCLNSNTASNMTVKVAKIRNGRKQGRLCMIEFHFFGMPIKTLGSLGKIRVGRVTGNTHFFFLPNKKLLPQHPLQKVLQSFQCY